MSKKKNHIKSLPLNEIAYQKIKELIVTLKLGPRDQLDEEWLAKKIEEKYSKDDSDSSTSSGCTIPEHITRIILTLCGYCILAVPARSAAA